MKRYLVSLLSVLFLFALPASGQQSETMRVNADRVNLRKAPSVDSGIVRALTKGALVTVVSRDGNWVKVQLPGQTATGWVRSDLLVAVPATSSTAAPAPPSAPAPQAQQRPVPPPLPLPPPPVVPPPPPAGRRIAPPQPPKPHSEAKGGSYRGGFTIFGGITSFTGVFTPDPGFTPQNASGFAAGIGIIKHIGGPVGIEIDGAYVQKGVAATGNGITATEHDNYVAGSLLLRPAFGSGPVRVFLLGGGEVGYLISCANATTGTGTVAACTIGKDQNRMDYGALVGGGVSFGPLAVQVRYNIGVANLSKTTGVTAKNKGLMVLGSLIL